MGRRRTPQPTTTLQLKAADPFELIRRLARSPSDLRRADIVLRSRGRAEDAEPLDAIAEILAHAERNLRGG